MNVKSSNGRNWIVRKGPSIFTSRKGKEDVRILRQNSDWGGMEFDGKRYTTAMVFDAENNQIIKSETIANPGHRPGFLPNFLNDMGVNVYPFACLLMSSEFADELMTKENLNIKTEAKTIMKKMFMMGIFEYDQDRDIMNILYDGDSGWRKCSGDDISRDTDKYAKELKQLIKFNR